MTVKIKLLIEAEGAPDQIAALARAMSNTCRKLGVYPTTDTAAADAPDPEPPPPPDGEGSE